MTRYDMMTSTGQNNLKEGTLGERSLGARQDYNLLLCDTKPTLQCSHHAQHFPVEVPCADQIESPRSIGNFVSP